jgi:hypothetical protein
MVQAVALQKKYSRQSVSACKTEVASVRWWGSSLLCDFLGVSFPAAPLRIEGSGGPHMAHPRSVRA